MKAKEILNEKMFMTSEHYFPFISQILNVIKTGKEPEYEKKALSADLFDRDVNEISPDTETKASNVAVLPITGALTKFGTWWDYGAEDYAKIINEAMNDDTVKAIILKWHCVGGSDGAMITLKNTLLNRKKPVLSVIDNMDLSAAVYISQFTDAIYAVDEMATIGSIGVMISFKNYDKWYQDQGIEIHEIYPPESNWKNKTYRDAKKGDYDLIISEELTPWAKHFQDTVKANSPKLNEEVEGILAGRVFYAGDAVEYGLIKEIKPMDQIIQMAFEYSNDQFKKLITN